jgi:DNA polymerase I-like protein with 3'-5' exonuclease and polymerase domains
LRTATKATSVKADRLAELRDSGCDSELLLARIAYMLHEGTRKDLAKLAGVPRVFPEILPTQASGRWSTKKPNLGGFTREFWKLHYKVVLPDDGWWWLGWDWSGIEARIFTAYTGDEEDILWLSHGYDIHTLTCQKYLFEWPEGWLPSDWQGSKDERRVRAKNFRYGVLQYGAGPGAILGMPGIEKLGLDREVLLDRARRFLRARPKAVAWKERTWQQAIDQKVTRTFMGRRRELFGEPDARKKQGLVHTMSGSVADMMDWCLIEIDRLIPQCHLILNKHDGALLAFPETLDESIVISKVRAIVEREWEIGQGVPPMRFPGEWEKVYSDGRRVEFA